MYLLYSRSSSCNQTAHSYNRPFVFSVVRHPFSRLVSAYNFQIKRFSCRYRQWAKKTNLSSLGNDTWWERQEEDLGCKDWYVIWRTWQNHICPVLSKDPSPKEVVRFLNSHMTPDYHNGMVMFRLLSRQCSYCSVKFGAIMKMETFRRDLKAISDGLGLGLQASVRYVPADVNALPCVNIVFEQAGRFYWKLKTFVLGCNVK